MLLSIVIVAILFLLCCCSGVAARLPQEPLRLRLNLQAPSAEALRNRLTEKLRGKDVQLSGGAEEGCAVRSDSLVVPVGAVCRFSLPTSTTLNRQLVLSLNRSGSGGNAVAAQLAQQVQTKEVTSGETVRKGANPAALDVYRQQGGGAGRKTATLTLRDCTVDQMPKGLEELQLKACTLDIGK